MPPKTIKHAIKDMLSRLPQQDLDNFRHQLVDRREEPQVKLNKVEGKSVLVIADVLVSTFTEAKAPAVAEEVLRDIDCSEEADRLVREINGLSSNAGSSGRCSAAAAGHGCSSEEHFVDKHSADLIDRVSNIDSILDKLLQRKVIQQPIYDEILKIRTNRDKMRRLYTGPLNAAGDHGKDIFYNLLEEMEPLLVADLKRKN